MRRIPERYLRWLFLIGMGLKALDGFVELACGVVLFCVNLPALRLVVAMMTRGELIEDPHDVVANFFLRSSRQLTTPQKHFATAYLAGHGVIKLAMALAVLSKRKWLYPPAMLVFCVFLAYELYELAVKPSLWLGAVCAFDAVVLTLIWHEYRRLRTGARMP